MFQKYKTSLHHLILFSVVLLACGGCGNGQLRVYPVAGKILFDGQPMEGGGSIAFIPLEGQEGKAAGGSIDEEDGTYKISTYAEGDGSIPGKFRVVITQTAILEPEATPDGTAPTESIPMLSQEKLIPGVYSDFQASPLTATVEETTNELDFDLKRDVGPPAGQPQQLQQQAGA